MTTSSPLLQGEVTSLRLEQLSIGAQLGRGASAKVYLATHTPTNKQLALKVLDNDLEASLEHRRLLLNEVKLVYNARSDHLLTFFDAFFHEGHIYLALEYMDMGSLERLFDAPKQAGARLPEQVLANVLVQVLDGLAAYAEAGVTDLRIEVAAHNEEAKQASREALAEYLA